MFRHLWSLWPMNSWVSVPRTGGESPSSKWRSRDPKTTRDKLGGGRSFPGPWESTGDRDTEVALGIAVAGGVAQDPPPGLWVAAPAPQTPTNLPLQVLKLTPLPSSCRRLSASWR